MAGFALSTIEVARLRDVVGLAATAVPGPGTMRQLMDGLEEFIGCDHVTCCSIDVAARCEGYEQEVASGEHVLIAREQLAGVTGTQDPFYDLIRQTSFRRRTLLPGPPFVQSISQFATPQEWRDDPMREMLETYSAQDLQMGYLPAAPVVDSMGAVFPVSAGRSRRLLLRRCTGRRFGDRERFLLELVQPHLEHQVHATATLPDDPALRLTPRQREIVALVAEGLANKQIARQLAISEGTVRKHLENAYARLDVQSRTAAVAALAVTAER